MHSIVLGVVRGEGVGEEKVAVRMVCGREKQYIVCQEIP